MKYLFLFIALSSCTLCMYAQKFPANKYSTGNSLGDYVERAKERSRVYTLHIGYARMSFLNPTFGKNRKEGIISPDIGFYLNNRVAINPFALDLNLFYQGFSVKEDINNAFCLGAEISASTIILPLNYHISSVFAPYIGAGYQFAGLYATNNADKKESAVNVSSPIWKVGATVNLHQNFSLDFQYKQSMFGNKDRQNNQWLVGMGFRGKALYIPGTVALILAGIVLKK